MRNSQKGIAPLIILAIIAGAVVLGSVTYYSARDYVPPQAILPVVTPAPLPPRPGAVIDTSSWLSYKNEERGIEFKYPASFNLTELNRNEAHFGSGRFAVVEVEGPTGVKLTVYSDSKKEWVDVCYNDPNFNEKSREPVALGGSKGFKHAYSDAAMGGARAQNVDYRFLVKGVCYGIDTSVRYSEAASFKEYANADDRARAIEIERLKNQTFIAENSAILEKIVSTVVLAETQLQVPATGGSPVVVGDVSTWKTFTNDARGFSFKYPRELFIRPSPGGNTYLATYSVDETGRLPKKNELTFRITVIQAPPPFPGSTAESTFGLAPWFTSLESSFDLEDVQEVTFAGEPAILVERETLKENPRGTPAQTSTRFFRNGVRYQITYAPADSDLKEVAEQMLSTFMFNK